MREADPLLDRLSEDFAAEEGLDDPACLERAIAGALEREAPARRARRRWPFLLAAAALVVGAAAAARRLATSPPAPGAPRPAEAAPVARAPEPVPEPVVAAESLPAEPEPARSAAPVAKPPPSAAPTSASASELFARANAARRAKRYDEAIRLYRELQQRYPGSREAQASRVTLGQLLLDHTDAKQALDEFDDYLARPGGTVSEEALVGRARALDRLGKQAEARAAWQELLGRYPSSVHAAEARRKLGQP